MQACIILLLEQAAKFSLQDLMQVEKFILTEIPSNSTPLDENLLDRKCSKRFT